MKNCFENLLYMVKKIFLSVLLVLPLTAGAQSLYPGQFAGCRAVPDKVRTAVECFNLGEVRLLPGRFMDNMLRDSAWMASVDAGRLLHSFRTNAGVFSGKEGGYMTVEKLGGWESLDCDLRGHTTGHFLSACALMYASTGEELFRMKGDSLVSGLAEVQAALGSGYLSAFPEGLIDRNIAGKSVWAPWYTLHKILSGLIDQYLYAGNTLALEVASGMGDWAYAKLSPLGEDTRQRMIRNEFGGINEAFYNLYSLTGKEEYLFLAHFFYHNDVIDPLAAGEDNFGTKHTNTFIPKVIAEARNYELTGSGTSRTVAGSFWRTVTGRHTFATGSCSDKEHFFDPDRMSEHLSGYTGETCCTYNMLKLSRHLFCWEPSAEIAGYYERALYNHILGQQDPESGMVCYFLPLASGSYKVYSTPENSFWCCVGSGFESHAKYGESIYFHDDGNVYVNLFIPSVLDWKEKGLNLVQKTSFPDDDRVDITLVSAPEEETGIFLRYPEWSGIPEVAVNGKKVKVEQDKGSYIKVVREWKAGDRITARFPMSLRLESTPDNPSKAAVLYGPVVLAGQMGRDGMEAPAPFSDPSKYNDYYTYDYNVPQGLETSLELKDGDIAKTLKRVSGSPLTFVTEGGLVLKPLYDTHHERYVVYWDL